MGLVHPPGKSPLVACAVLVQFFWVYTLGQHNRNHSLFPALLLFGTSFGDLIVATAVPQIQGLAPLIPSAGSGVSSSSKSRTAPDVPSQGRAHPHLWKCRFPGTEARKELFSSRMVKLASKITWDAKTPLPSSQKSHSSPRCLRASSTLCLQQGQSGVGRSGQQHFHKNPGTESVGLLLWRSCG